MQVTFNQPETLTAADVTLLSAKHINYGPVTITGSGTTYIITLARPITVADRVTITIASPGSTGIATYTRRLDVLPGDFNDDGVVNQADVIGVRNEVKGVTAPTLFGDIVGDVAIDASDLSAVKKHNGTRLPKLRGNHPQAVLARALARQHHGTRRSRVF